MRLKGGDGLFGLIYFRFDPSAAIAVDVGQSDGLISNQLDGFMKSFDI